MKTIGNCASLCAAYGRNGSWPKCAVTVLVGGGGAILRLPGELIFKTSQSVAKSIHSLFCFRKKTKDNRTQKEAVQNWRIGKLLCEQNSRADWSRIETVRAEIGQILNTHRHMDTRV